jgi:integrase
MRAKSNLKLVPPPGENRAVSLVRRPNAEFRSREHLTPTEVATLIEAAKSNRHGQRDATMILVAYRHGFRAAEVCDLGWDAVDFDAATMQVRRVKNGKPSTHPIRGDELRELRKLRKDQAPQSAFVFVTERGGPFTPESFNHLVKRAGQKAKLPFQVHAHMLRHSTGYKLAGDGHDTRSIQDYLGHKDIRHTVRYTELSPKPFRDFWRD